MAEDAFLKLHQKQRLARITEPSNNDYNNDYDDFGVKGDQKVSHNIILMPKCKRQHGGKKGQNFRPFWAMPERKHFFCGRCSLIENGYE